MKKKTKTTAAVVAAAVGLTVVASGAGATAARMVTSKQIQNGTIKSVDVRDNNLQGRDIRDGSLTGADIRDGSLTARDFSGLVAGPAGQDGADGANGASAYDIWLAQGNQGSEQDFLDSLVGPAGEKGDPGTAPEAPATRVVYVTSRHSVSAAGTSNHLECTGDGWDTIEVSRNTECEFALDPGEVFEIVNVTVDNPGGSLRATGCDGAVCDFGDAKLVYAGMPSVTMSEVGDSKVGLQAKAFGGNSDHYYIEYNITN